MPPELPPNLTDKLEALAYIHGASTLPEFGVRSAHVLLANNNKFPDWWDELGIVH